MSGIHRTIYTLHEPVETSAVFTDHMEKGGLTGDELVTFLESDHLAQLVPERRIVIGF